MLKFKKEVKHSVVYETDDEKAPTRSIYISKEWLRKNSDWSSTGKWPQAIELEVKVPVAA